MAEKINTDKTIFFSYSFKDKKVVDDIDKDFQGFPGINIKRCVRDLEYTDSIKEFMKKVRDTDFVFIVISDAFIKSTNCMYEITELFKEENFKERILPIVPYESGDVRRAKIFTPDDRAEYIIHWNKRRDDLDKKIKDIPRESTPKLDDDLKKYREISNIVGEFIDTVADMNYVPLEKLKSNRYKQILKKIGYEETDKESEVLSISTIEEKEERDIELDEFINKYPKYFGGYFHKGYIAVDEEKKYKSGLHYYTKAIELKPDLAEVYNNRGSVYCDLQIYDTAIADFTKAIELKPDFAVAYNNRGNVYDILEKYYDAIVNFDKAIDLMPDFAEAYYNRGIVNSNLQKYEKAIADYIKAIELKPDFAEAYYNRGLAYYNIQNYDDSIADYTKAIDLKPDYADAYYNRGLIYGKEMNDHPKAINDFNKAIEFKPEFADVYNNRGNTFAVLKRYGDAIADFTKAIEFKPDLVEVYNNRGIAYFYSEKFEDAINDWEKAIELNPVYKNKVKDWIVGAKEKLKKQKLK
ncbi:MAG TPA: tetratricopeptide repeat protein [Ignavibacteria bacterium]